MHLQCCIFHHERLQLFLQCTMTYALVEASMIKRDACHAEQQMTALMRFFARVNSLWAFAAAAILGGTALMQAAAHN